MTVTMTGTQSGARWLIDVLHEVVHAHSGSGAACLFLPADDSELAEHELACPAMTPDLRAVLEEAVADFGLQPGEQREPARLLLPSVTGREQAVAVPVVWAGRAAGVLITAAADAPLGRAGLARVTELAGRGWGWVSAAADTAAELVSVDAERARIEGELTETRMFLDLQERLVAARTTAEVVRALASWLNASVAVQLPNLIVMEAAGPDARDLALTVEGSAAEHELLNRTSAGGTRVLPAGRRLPARAVAPIASADGGCAGFLLAAVGERGREVTRRALDVSRGLIAYQMSVRQDIEASVATLRQRLLTDVLDNRSIENIGTRAAKLGHDLSQPHVPFAIGVRSGAVSETVRERLLRITEHAAANASMGGAAALIGALDDVVVAFVPEPIPAGAAALAHSIRTEGQAAGLDVVVGMGPTCTGPAQMSPGAARARWAEQVLHDPQVGSGTPVAHIDDLGIYGLLFDHRRAGELHEFALRWLGPLLDYDRKHRSELVATLRELIRQRSLTETAAVLHIHISTLKYRIGRIEEILGRSVEAWDNVFHLELALRVLAVSGRFGVADAQAI